MVAVVRWLYISRLTTCLLSSLLLLCLLLQAAKSFIPTYPLLRTGAALFPTASMPTYTSLCHARALTYPPTIYNPTTTYNSSLTISTTSLPNVLTCRTVWTDLLMTPLYLHAPFCVPGAVLPCNATSLFTLLHGWTLLKNNSILHWFPLLVAITALFQTLLYLCFLLPS